MEKTIRKIESRLPTLPVQQRVAAYARVSSGKDAMLHSLSAQVSYYSDLIQRNPEWRYAGVYVDEALTGTKDNRKGFQRMLVDCRAGKIDRIITKSISRFARNTVTLLETVRQLKTLGVDVYFEEQNIHSMSGDGELMLSILASFAQEESLSVSENCKWRIRKQFELGEPATWRFMYGYRIRKGVITIHEEEAAVVRWALSLTLMAWASRKFRASCVKRKFQAVAEACGRPSVFWICSRMKSMPEMRCFKSVMWQTISRNLKRTITVSCRNTMRKGHTLPLCLRRHF